MDTDNTSTTEEINEIIVATLRELVRGQCKVSKANAIFHGIRLLQIQYDNESSLEGPIPIDSETSDFRTMLLELYSQDATREWQSPEIRAVAVKLGLFRAWLTSENADSYSSMSRFGLLCERQLNRKHNGLALMRRGCGRHRVFTIAQNLAQAA
jgi:hypothetical protein